MINEVLPYLIPPSVHACIHYDTIIPIFSFTLCGCDVFLCSDGAGLVYVPNGLCEVFLLSR